MSILGTSTITLILGIVFLCFAMTVSNACYVDPCYEGEGLQELWKVNKGVSFTTMNPTTANSNTPRSE